MLKHMPIFAFIGALALLLSACGKDDGNPVYGTWLAQTGDVPAGGDISMNVVLKIKIEADQVSAISECSVASLGLSTSALVAVPAQVTSNQLIINGEGSQNKKLNVRGTDFDCKVEIERGTYEYQVSENSLTLKDVASGETHTMSRVE